MLGRDLLRGIKAKDDDDDGWSDLRRDENIIWIFLCVEGRRVLCIIGESWKGGLEEE